jgi:hypothetical protein
MVTGIVGKVFGPTCKSAGLLAGRVHLTGTSGTLVGGDPWVPMSLKPPIDCRRSGSDEVRTMCGSRTGIWSLPCVMSD